MIDKTYNPKNIENHWYEYWEQQGYFAPTGKGKSYCIAIPPPNVTGTLHMGHGFQQSLMDALIRYHRMRGFNTLWQGGTDHAGIATQMVVEKKLLQEGTDRHQLGREVFEKKIWEWKQYSGDTITNQERRLGVSIDWQREKFTLDPDLVKAVQHVFVSLYEEGLIYRGQRLVNWDPVLKTAISDLEVISEEHEGNLWYIHYPLADSTEKIVIATTRPETMLGDVAVAVHPEDPRYKHLIGKFITLPIANRTIPIIADTYVDQEFGSGCVKITPAHDFNDYLVGQKHNLPCINIFTPDARINENAPKAYQGLDRFVARKMIIAELQALGLLLKITSHISKIPKGDRSDAIIEPYLTHQWFVKTKELAAAAIKVVENGKLIFIPENWSKTYFHWLLNIEDWCISRQLWWGHRIPAWYDQAGNIYVGHDENEIRTKYNLQNITLKQDEDVLDTWFSASLWPFSTLGWPNQTQDLKTFYPTNVLITGFDIIFFWVARMVMMGLKFTGTIPFHEVYITGLIRDSKGQKMSKSKGNIIDPVDLIDGIELDALITKRTNNLMQPHLAEKIAKNTQSEFPHGISAFGADAVRFTFAALATTSREINFDLNRLEGYRNFCTKIWNATRFVLMQTENYHIGADYELTTIDHWIYSELQKTIVTVTNEFANYRFDLITQAIYNFVWYEFCDWYLEITKPILHSEQIPQTQKNGTCHTLLAILDACLRLLHPFMPFITEEIWQKIAPKIHSAPITSIMIQPYPEFDASKINANAIFEITWLKKIILAIRNIRGEMNIAATKQLPLWLHKGTTLDRELVSKYQDYLLVIAKLASINWYQNTKIPSTVTALCDELELHIPIANLVDITTETIRLSKEITKLEAENKGTTSKLANVNYLAKAPVDVINKEKTKLVNNQQALVKLQQRLKDLKGH
jgi:valyl-tRNA synthetase